MHHYECPQCGNISTEGLSLIGGPECLHCGTEMVYAEKSETLVPYDI
jgi:predicted RNA-binding Zn-ribbon protein involved in translation (DUF1610 family)